MRQILLSVVFLLAVFLPVHLSASDLPNSPSNSILVINSYTAITQWSDKFITAIYQEYGARESHMDIHTEHMNMVTINDQKALDQYKQRFAEKYAQASPKLIILLGTSAWVLMNQEIGERWKDVPVIVCNENKYIGPLEIYLEKSLIPQDKRTLLSDYRGNIPLTIFYAPCYAEETLELMKKLSPKMNQLVFLTDKRVISAQYRKDVDEAVQTRYPDLKVRHLIAGDITNDDLVDTLKRLTPGTCVLYSSWFNREVQQGNAIFTSDISKLLYNYTKVPIFTLHNLNLKQTNGLIGGCFQMDDVFTHTLSGTIREVLESPHPEEVKVVEMGTPRAIINYPDLVSVGLKVSLCPSDTLFYNRPPSFFHRNWYYILAICMISAILYIVWLKRIAKERGARLNAMEQYNSLFENMPILYLKEEVIYDGNGRITDFIFREINPVFEKYVVPRSQIIGKKYSEVSAHPQDLIILYNTLSDKKELSFQYYIEQTRKYLTIVVTPSRQKGFVDVFGVDSSELAETQKMLRSANHKLSTALDVANITPWKWDIEKHTILCDVNRPVEILENQGISSEQQLSVPESSYFSNICNEDIDRVKAAYQRLIDGKVTKVKEEFRIVSGKDDPSHYDWVEVHAAVDEYDENGKAKTLVGSSLIITQRKAMEDDLIRAKEKAEESNKLKSAFLANMSHEIRTPLNAIVGFSGVLASIDNDKNTEKQEYVQIIENNNNLLLQLISDILDLSKIEAGMLAFNYACVDVDEVMSGVEEIAKLRNKNEHVRITYLHQMPGCCIRTDKNRLTQVITNMVNNAMKFTKEGSIEFGCRLQDPQTVLFYVRDTGCGIAAEKAATVFDRFVKLDNFAQGTGLGLSICRTIVEHMGGKIGVDSTQEKGSTFWFTLPYQPMDKDVREGSDDLGHLLPIDGKDKLIVLIAEDNESNYKLFESILKTDYTLIHAWDGEEAVRLFREYNPHLVLMDISMPKMDGYEATRRIREISPSVPVMAVTAYAYAEDEQRILKGGFNAYAAKPIQSVQLKMQIGQLLKKHFLFL